MALAAFRTANASSTSRRPSLTVCGPCASSARGIQSSVPRDSQYAHLSSLISSPDGSLLQLPANNTLIRAQRNCEVCVPISRKATISGASALNVNPRDSIPTVFPFS